MNQIKTYEREDRMRTLIAGALIAFVGLIGTAASAQADPTPTPTPTQQSPGWTERDIHKAICNDPYWRKQYLKDCVGLGL
jgi:hypothetical protein